jgi:hypothetical protein
MQWIRSYDSFVDFISYVLLSAPDDFSREDYLSDDEQMTLDKAFEELNGGMKFVAAKVKDDAVVAKLQSILDESHAAYRKGDKIKGAYLLQDFEKNLLNHTKPSTR